MFRTAIIVGVICAAGLGATLWLEMGGKSGSNSETVGAMSAEAMPPLQELHIKAGLATMPVQIVQEPY
jgi:hypothetical protein